MRYKISTETTKSQVFKRIIVGVDMGGKPVGNGNSQL